MKKIFIWIFVLILLSSFVSAVTYNETFKSYYEVNTTNQGFASALNYCTGLGDGWSLARIDSAEENTYVRSLIGGDAWIGGSDSGTEGTWKWQDNRTFYIDPTTITYSNWDAGEPSGDDYLGIKNSDGKWIDTVVGDGRRVVCENHLDELYLNSSQAIWYLNDSIYNNTDSIKDSFGGYDGTGFGKTFYNGVNNGATYNNNLTGTITGATWNTSCTLNDGSVGNCLEFDGSGDYVDIGSTREITTMCLNSYKPSQDDDQQYYTMNTAGDEIFGIRTSNTVNIYESGWKSFGYFPNLNVWENYCIVYNVDHYDLYVNGVFESSTSNSNKISMDYISGTSTNTFNGKISDVIILDTALNSTEILNLYNTGRVDTEGYYHEKNFALNEGSGSTVQGKTGKFGGNYEFDGVNDYMLINDSENMNLDSLTISSWIKIDGFTNFMKILSKMEDSTVENSYEFLIDSDQKLRFTPGKNNTVGSEITSDTILQKDIYYYATITYDKTNMKLYLNGDLDKTKSYSDDIYNGNGRLVIGARYDSGDVGYKLFFNGSIDEVKIWNRSLNETEIKNEMNANAINNSKNIIFYYSFNNDINTTVLDQNHLSTGYKQSLYTTDDYVFMYDQATNFDGSNDKIVINSPPSINNNFTISFWEYTKNGVGYFISDGSDVTNFFLRRYTSTHRISGQIGEATFPTVANVPYNQWNFHALISNGTYAYWYVNNELLTETSGSNFAGLSGNLVVGNRDDSARPFNGSIADVRIYDRALTEDEIHWLYNNFEFQTLINFSNHLVGEILQVSNDNYAYNYTIEEQTLIQTTIDLYNLSVYRNNTLIYQQELNVTNNSQLNLSTLDYNYIYFTDELTQTALANDNITLTYPNSDTLNLVTDSEGKINFTTYRDLELQYGNYSLTYGSTIGYVSPISFSYNTTILPFNVTYNISKANITVLLRNAVTNNLIDENMTVIITDIGEFSTITGNLTLYNTSIVSGSYIVSATNENYTYNQKTFTFTNQEQITITLYLYEKNQSGLGIVQVNVYDAFLNIVPSTNVKMQEYDPDSFSFVESASGVTDSNGQVYFQVLLENKAVRFYAQKTIDGITYEAYSTEDGSVIYVDGTTIDIYLNTIKTYTEDPKYGIQVNVTNTELINNISYHSVSYNDPKGLDHTICLNYKYEDGLDTINLLTVCNTSSSGTINYGGGYAFDRNYTYIVSVYLNDSDYVYTYYRERYPYYGNIEDQLKDVLKPIIVSVLLILLAISLYLRRIDYFIYLDWIITAFWVYIAPSYVKGIELGIMIVLGIAVLYLAKTRSYSENV